MASDRSFRAVGPRSSGHADTLRRAPQAYATLRTFVGFYPNGIKLVESPFLIDS
jgi:hypothetical protein